MIKRPFLLFIGVVGTLIAGLLWFIQSPQFAQVFKAIAIRYIPKDIGVDWDFSELSIALFPPGVSIKSPKLVLGKQNIAKLPSGSSVIAERIDLNFQSFQIFSGDIRVHEVTIVNGDINLVLDPLQPKKKPATQLKAKLGFHWDELLQVRAEAVALQNVRLNVRFSESSDSLGGNARLLRLSQWPGRGSLGYSLNLDLEQIQGNYLKKLSLPTRIDRVQGEAFINARGLRLESLSIFNPGFEISATGQVKGNLLEPKELLTDLAVKANGNLGQVLRLMEVSPQSKNLPDGSLSFSGKAQGNLAKISESLHAEGTITVNNFSFQKWRADKVQVEAKWDASPSGGEVSLVKATISAQEQARVGGSQPGQGGKIEVGPLKWVLGSSSPVQVPLRFERAHIHWLGAQAIKDVYPLDFRLNGAVSLLFSPSKKNQPWEMEANLEAWVEKFQFDNQRYLQKKPLSTVFKMPRIGLDGIVKVNSQGIYPVDLAVTLPHSKILANGKIDFKTGYDLSASGAVLLNDFGQLADNDIRGQGVLNARIHGPTSNVLIEVDADLKDAYYLNLFLGDVKGRIIWDDDPSHLLFSKVQVKKNQTVCAVNGILDLDKADTVDLDVQIPQGNIKDLIQIFDNLAKPISWFPHELNGPVSGELKVTGGISFSKLQVLARLNGTNWEHWGERFKTLHIVGGYDRGKYSLDEFDASKRIGKVLGKISYSSERKLEWDFHTQGFTVSDLDHLVQLDVPIRGKVDIQSSGEGLEGSISSYTQLDLKDLTVRGIYMPPSQMSLRTKEGVARLQGSAIGGQGVLDVLYDFNPKKFSYIHGEFKQLDFSPVLLLLNTKSIQDRSLAGYISGSVNLNFHSGGIEGSDGVLNISEYLLARTNSRFILGHPLSIKITEGNFDINNAIVKGKAGDVALSLRNVKSKLEGSITGELDTSLVEFFTSSVVQASGTSKIDFAIGGKLKEPTLFGRVYLGGDSVRVASLDSPFENVTGVLQLRQNILTVQNVQADLGGGRITADGQVVINSDRYPEVSLKALVNGSKIKVFPFQYVKVSGKVAVLGSEPPYAVTGNLEVDSALSREKVLNQKRGVTGLKAVQYAPPTTKQGENSYPKFKLNVEVEAKKGVLIQNDLFRDVEAKGNLTLVNTLDAPRILGSAEITEGKVLFKDHVFQIQSATANFDSPTVINPSFDLNANTEVNGVKIRMYATGRLDKIKIEFTSNPAMQESEILSLLAVGLTSSDAKKLSATDLSAVQQGEAASLVLHSLDFNRELEDKTGFQVKLDESVNQQQGVSAFRLSSQADTAAAPQITIRRKLNDRLSLSAGSTVGAGSNKSNQLNMDFSVNQDLSVSGVFNNYGTYGNVDTQSSTQSTTQSNQNSFGLDLKFQKRFK